MRLAAVSHCGPLPRYAPRTTRSLANPNHGALTTSPSAATQNPAGSRGWPRPARLERRSDAQSIGHVFYSLLRRRCYARHGVDRPASRHAGPRSLLPRPPQRPHGSTAMLKPMIDVPLASLRRPPDALPGRSETADTVAGRSAAGETRKLAAIFVSDVVGYSRLTGASSGSILARLRWLRRRFRRSFSTSARHLPLNLPRHKMRAVAMGASRRGLCHDRCHPLQRIA